MDPLHINDAFPDGLVASESHHNLVLLRTPSADPSKPNTTAVEQFDVETKNSINLRAMSFRMNRRSVKSQTADVISLSKSLDTGRKLVKKSSSSFLSIFSTREPSSQALEEYEKMIKKQHGLEKDQPLTVGISMASSAKLPANVPKVNSKWDGIPKAVKASTDKKSRSNPSLQISRPSSAQTSASSKARSFFSTSSMKKARQDQASLFDDGFSVQSKVPNLDCGASMYSQRSTPLTPSTTGEFPFLDAATDNSLSHNSLLTRSVQSKILDFENEDENEDEDALQAAEILANMCLGHNQKNSNHSYQKLRTPSKSIKD
jgi:hypothetical protein